jgi:hypothetical protein
MLDDSDSRGEPSSVEIPLPLSPSAPPSEPMVHAPLEPGPSYSNQNNEPPDLNSLQISSPPFSPTSSGNASPITPNHPEHDQKPAKRPNPLIDLIDTEKSYVDLLSGIIRVSLIRFPNHYLPNSILETRKWPQRGRRTTFPQRNSMQCFVQSKESIKPIAHC